VTCAFKHIIYNRRSAAIQLALTFLELYLIKMNTTQCFNHQTDWFP